MEEKAKCFDRILEIFDMKIEWQRKAIMIFDVCKTYLARKEKR